MRPLPRAVLLTLGTLALSGLFVSALNNEPLISTEIRPWGASTSADQAWRVAIVAAYLGLVGVHGAFDPERTPDLVPRQAGGGAPARPRHPRFASGTLREPGA